ncbi:MAG: deoxyribodipyrimidine photo-lyase [Beijerinckiaceae bacterium]|nr:deoxyribodipyrimidine photo-lyase [Beijerinckiaceae bacterium]
MLQVVWFKRDLRIVDHAPLVEAAQNGPVLPIYVAEPSYWALQDTSGRQWEAFREGLVDLRGALARLGQPLVIRQGEAVKLFRRLHARHGIAHLWSHEETGNNWTYDRDKAVGAFCREAGIPWTELPQFGVVRRLKSRDQWSRAFENFMRQPCLAPPRSLPPLAGIEPGSVPDAAELGLAEDPCPGRQPGGRQAALILLDSFFAGRGRRYTSDMSNPLAGERSCSRLSVHLATGSISLRETLQRAHRERSVLNGMPPEMRPVELRSVDSLIARLHWHCHFIQKLESEPSLEFRSVHRLHEANRQPTPPDHPHLLAWAAGRTGFPFLDACMRALAATGWLNFRMRAMVQAFASYHLALDWAQTGLHLARSFTDYEPGIHWPQVQMQSGHTGINTPRIYNPVKQGLDQDPDGLFTRKWVPELAEVPLALLQEPWRMDAAQQAASRCRIGQDYPLRIVDHEVASREARARLGALRRMDGYIGEARRVYQRHGSRKRHPSDARAMENVTRARNDIPVSPPDQLDLDI